MFPNPEHAPDVDGENVLVGFYSASDLCYFTHMNGGVTNLVYKSFFVYH